MKILIVEDEIMIAEAVAQVLRKNNYSVDIAADGEDGLDCALSGIYPMTCKPEDVFGAYEFRRKALMFSDITMRGYYPNYAQSIFQINAFRCSWGSRLRYFS